MSFETEDGPKPEENKLDCPKSVATDFCVWTSAHGIPHIGNTKSKWMAVFWTVISAIACVLLGVNIVLLIVRYLRYDVTVGVELKFTQRGFPAVTICDLNPYRASKLDGHPKIQKLMTAYQLAVNHSDCVGNCVLSPAKQTLLKNFGLLDIQNLAELHNKVKNLMILLMEGMTAAERKAVSHPKEEIIKACSFNTRDCSIEEDFTIRQDPAMGSCYTFNAKEPVKFRTSRAGPLYGLRVILLSDRLEHLPMSQAEGFTVAIHNQSLEPFPDTYGYKVEIGSGTSMGVSYRNIVRLPAPYGDCIDTEKILKDYRYEGAYTAEGCQRTCLQKEIEAQCGCRDPHFPPYEISYPCEAGDPLQRECWHKLVEDPDRKLCSECAVPCKEGLFDVTVSSAFWPSSATLKIADCDDEEIPDEYYNSCIYYYAKNGALLEVFYEQLNYQELNESPGYEFVNLASDFGGQIGLWLGLSAISIIEFIVLICRLCSVSACK